MNEIGLPIKNAGSPLQTNASLNRQAASKVARAVPGCAGKHIADYWPEIFGINELAQLYQKYDYELADGSGRFETNRRITDASVRGAIKTIRALVKKENPK